MSFTFIITLFLIGFIGSYISGMVGIGGSIIKYPMLLYIPPLVGIAAFTAHEVSGLNASSLAITFISSIGTAAGKIATEQVLLLPAIILVVASILGAPLGAKAGKTMNTKYLQRILAGLILASAIKIWFELFN